jgi:hypothetical protein
MKKMGKVQIENKFRENAALKNKLCTVFQNLFLLARNPIVPDP